MGTAVSNLHITFVGRANVGKSRLVNCIFNESQFNPGEFQHREKEGKTEFVRILPNGEFTIVETVIVDDKGTVDFQTVERKPMQIAEGRIPCAEVIQCQFAAQRPQ